MKNNTSANHRSRQRVALVTGGSSGIGRSLVRRLCEEDIKVAFTFNKNEADAARLINLLGNDRVKAYALDARSSASMRQAVRRCIRDFGDVSFLINNAGIQGPRSAISDYPLKHWNEVLQVNLTAAYFMTKQIVPGMMRRRFGRIVNVSSIAASEGYPFHAAYSASKAGLIGLTKTLARELAPFNINVNAVLPGLTDTRMAAQLDAASVRRIISLIPKARMATVEEVSNVILFLLLHESDYITGEAIRVAGGR